MWLDTAAAAAMAARRAVVNDELCREFADAGGAEAVLRAMLSSPEEDYSSSTPSSSNSTTPSPLHHARLARSCCSLLRQLAGSDALKERIVEGRGFELVSRVVAAHGAKRHTVAEQALGLLVALTLRNPDACAAAVEAGCVAAAADVLRSEYSVSSEEKKKKEEKQKQQKKQGDTDDDDGENAAPFSSKKKNDDRGKSASTASAASSASTFSRNPHQWAQRQACAAIRNLVSRSPELRPVLLAWPSSSSEKSEKSENSNKLEPLLREARDRYPEACGDVGAAALRDLGCDDYDGKKQQQRQQQQQKKKMEEVEAAGRSTSSNDAAASRRREAADGRFGVAV